MGSTFERLWANVNDRNMIMERAEHIAGYFKDKIKDPDGNTARFVSVKNIEFSLYNEDNVKVYFTDIELLSDQGSEKVQVIIKYFDSLISLKDEVSRYNNVLARCSELPNLTPYPVILVDKSALSIIYEVPKGYDIDDIRADNKVKNFLLGIITATLHGPNTSNYYHYIDPDFVKNLLNKIPYTPTDKILIRRSVNNIIKRLPYFAFEPVTLINPDYLTIVVQNPDYELNKIDIAAMSDLKVFIYPVPTTSYFSDRFSDIADLLIEDIVDDFILHGDEVKSSKIQVIHFMEGYEYQLDRLSSDTLDAYYPNGYTFQIQLLISFWLLLVRELKFDMDYEFVEDIILNFTYLLLFKRPFEFTESVEQIK